MKKKTHRCKQEDWEKEFKEDFKRKNWISTQWRDSKDEIDRLIWFISYLSPHNLWRARETIRDFISSQRKQAAIEELEYILTHASGGGDWRRVIEMRIAELKRV